MPHHRMAGFVHVGDEPAANMSTGSSDDYSA
jgi:hypothetical protein